MIAARSAAPSVLLVEDDAAVRGMMTYVLELAGYHVTATANGREALDHLRQDRRPDVIVLDLRMPVMDGWQFRVEQCHDPELASVPVVVVSGESPEDAGSASHEASGYLRKPVDLRELLETIGAIVEHSGPRRDEAQADHAAGARARSGLPSSTRPAANGQAQKQLLAHR
jgi:two-component system response regulator MprA